MKDSTFNYIMGADIPDEALDATKSFADMGTPLHDDAYMESVDSVVAEALIGKENILPGCKYKLVTDRYSSTLTRYNTNKSPDDPEYCAEFVLETYRPETNELDSESVRDGFWAEYDDKERKRLDVRYIIYCLFIILFVIGLGLLAFVIRL